MRPRRATTGVRQCAGVWVIAEYDFFPLIRVSFETEPLAGFFGHHGPFTLLSLLAEKRVFSCQQCDRRKFSGLPENPEKRLLGFGGSGGFQRFLRILFARDWNGCRPLAYSSPSRTQEQLCTFDSHSKFTNNFANLVVGARVVSFDPRPRDHHPDPSPSSRGLSISEILLRASKRTFRPTAS